MSNETPAAADATNAADAKPTDIADKLYADTKPADAEKPAEVQAEPAAADAQGDSKPAESNESKPDATEPADKVPEKYTFEVDEASHITDAQLEKIAQYAKEQGLSQEDAQKLVDMQVETMNGQVAEQQEQFKQMTNEWKAKASQDKEIGGTEFNRNVELAKRVVDKFASDDFKKALNDTGFGNHPELLRVFVRIGQAFGEDRLVLQGAQNSKPRSIEDIFYGAKT